MPSNKSTTRGRQGEPLVPDSPTLLRFAETLKLRGLAKATQEEYLRFARRLLERLHCAPEAVTEEQLRAHLLALKEEHQYSPSSMRTAVAAMRSLFGRHLGRDWKLFDLVRAPSERKLPTVLTRAEVGADRRGHVATFDKTRARPAIPARPHTHS